MLLTLLAFVLVLAFAFFIAASLRFTSRIAFLLSLFLLGYAYIVLTIEIASVLQSITPEIILGLHIVVTLLAGIAWFLNGRPVLSGPFHGHYGDWKSIRALRRHPELILLSSVVFIAYVIGAYLIVATPQNNYDSMTYHLSRVAYWLQHQTLFPWPTPNPRQTSFPPNAEIGILWTVLFWGSDRLSGFVQWLSVPAIMIGIFGLSRFLGAKRWQSLLLALVWAAFPEVFLQSTTTMNDLVSAAFFVCAVYFLIAGWQTAGSQQLFFSGLAVGLAIGAKATVILALPGLVCFVALLAFLNGKNRWKKMLTWGTASILAFLLVGAFSYAQNLAYYKNPFSISRWTNYFTNPPISRSELLSKNIFLYSVQMADLTGLPPVIRQPITQIKSDLVRKTVDRLPFSQEDRKMRLLSQIDRISDAPQFIHEDTAWFGPFFLLLLIPMIIYQFVIGIRQKEPLRLGYLAILFGFLFCLSYTQDWTPYRGRYFVLISPFAMPLLVPWFGSYRGSTIIRWLIILASNFILIQTLMFNHSKPLVGVNQIWSKDELDIRAITNPNIEPVLRAVDKFVPKEQTLATKLSVDAWDYPLFGKYLSRKIIQIDPLAGEIDFEQLFRQGVEYFLIQPQERTFLKIPPGLELIWQMDGWSLWHTCGIVECHSDAQAVENLFSDGQGQALANLSTDLAGKVGILDIEPGGWPIEQADGKGFYWLGNGFTQGLKIHLWSDDQREIKIKVDAAPGPSRPDYKRRLTLSQSWLKGYEINPAGEHHETKAFSAPQTLDFKVRLQRGLNEIHLQSGDIATIPTQPNGDNRPLLILVKNILIQN